VDALERTIDTVAKFLEDVILLFMIVVLFMNVRLIQPLFKIYLHGNYHVADDRLFFGHLLCIVALTSD
jgi:hypothetical protein